MENIFFLILIAVVGLFRLISTVVENRRNAEAGKRAGAAPAQPSTTPQRPPPSSEEERIRKFLEALGVPNAPGQTTPEAPPAVTRKIPPIDPFPAPRPGRSPLPPVVTTAPPPPVVAAPPPIPVAPLPLPASVAKKFSGAREKLHKAVTASTFEVQDARDLNPEDILPPPGSKETGLGNAPLQGLAARLATRQGLREAVVLREIFGPPRSMQPFERQTVG